MPITKTEISGRTVQTFVLSIGNLFTFCLSIAIAAILSRLLTKEDYGTFRQVIYVYTYMAIVFQVGLPKATSFFLPKLSLEEGKTTLKQIAVLLLASGFIFSGLLYFGADTIGVLLKNPDLPDLFRIYAPIPLFLLPTLALEGVCITFSMTGIYISFQIITKLLALVSVCLPIYLGCTMEQAIQWWCIVTFLSLCIALVVMFRPYRGTRPVASKYGLKEVFAFSMPMLFASILGTVLISADKFFIGRYYGVEVFADYINGAVEFPIITIIAGSTATVLLPQFSRLYEMKNSTNEMLEIWTRAISKSAMVLYPIAVFCFINAEEIISLLYSSKYSSSAIYFRIYLLLAIVRIVSYMPLMIGIGEMRSYVIAHIAACLVMWGGGFMLCAYGYKPFYVALCFVFSVFVTTLICFTRICRKFNVKIRDLAPYRSILTYLGLAVASGILTWLATKTIHNNTSYMRMIKLVASGMVFSFLYT